MLLGHPVRAERRCGELLARTERARPEDNLKRGPKSNDVTTGPTLVQMGLTKDESSRYQRQPETAHWFAYIRRYILTMQAHRREVPKWNVTQSPAALPWSSPPRWIRKIGLHPPLHPGGVPQPDKKKAPRLSR